MLKIINAKTPHELKKLSNEMFKVSINDGFVPDLVIGIANGGKLVVDQIDLDPNIISTAIKKQRQGTVVKQRFKAKKILPHLPEFVNNALRRVEVFARETRYKRANEDFTPKAIALPTAIIKLINSANSILIIDDTLDSGWTMAAVIASVQEHASSSCTIKSAVINQTFAEPYITADYCLLDRTIIRFPWADDVK